MSKILFVSPTGTLDNGAEISIFNLMKYLQKFGHQIFVVGPQSFQKNNDYKEKLEAKDIKVFLLPILKWWWEDAPAGFAGSVSQRAKKFRDYNFEIAEIIKQHGIDLVVTNTVNMSQGAIAAAICKVPHIWLIHEFPEGEFAYYLNKIPFIEQNSDKIFAVAGELEKNLKKYFVNKRVQSFIPFSEVNSSPLKTATDRRIISIGRLTQRKNQLELIRAFSKLNKKDVSLVLIGGWDEAYKFECDEFIKKNKVKNVIFIGNVKDPWSYVTNSDICVLPSSMETFGLVYVEALLKGIPVIVSDNLGFRSVREIFGAGEMYPCGEVEKLMYLINVYIDNFENFKEEYQSISITVQKKYTLEQAYHDLVQIIDEGIDYEEKDISVLSQLLIKNRNKNKLLRAEEKISWFWNKVKNRLQRMVHVKKL